MQRMIWLIARMNEIDPINDLFPGFDPDADREPFDSNKFHLEMMDFEGDEPSEIMRTARAWSGFTIEAAAERAGMSPGKLLDYERGITRPRWRTIERFARDIGVIGRSCPFCGNEKAVEPITNCFSAPFGVSDNEGSSDADALDGQP